jgi:hypothetical protein
VFKDFVVNFPQDTVKPVASLRGGSTVFAEINKPYNDSGIVATDNIEGNISAKYEIIGSVDNTKVGPNYLKYIVRDLYGNVSDTLYRTVFVILNQTGPSIQLSGSNSMYVEVFNKFTEPGFTAVNNIGTDISNQVIITSTVDTAKLGLYGITYTVIDAFGLSATAGRAVTVGDTTKPTITPIASPYIHQVGTAIDLSSIVRVRDNYWPTEFITVEIQGTVNVNQVGSYFITYKATDNSGNISPIRVLEVRVQDTKAPVITLKGANPLNWEVKAVFEDPGYDVSDNFWPKNTIVVTKRGIVNTNLIGDYTIWYIATDPSGNKDSVSRVVRVRDTKAPIIDLLGINEVNLPRWNEYKDPPIAIVDNYNSDASLRGFLVVTNSLPKNKEGNYFGDGVGLFSVTYSVRDSSGNVSATANRKIIVTAGGSVNELSIDNLLSVYPNPSTGVFNLRMLKTVNGTVTVNVFDMLGNRINHSTINGKSTLEQELNLTGNAAGIYFLELTIDGNKYVRKIQLK